MKNSFREAVEKAEDSGASMEELRTLLGRGRAKKGIFEGDLEEGELEIGQVSSIISRQQPVAEVMKELVEIVNKKVLPFRYDLAEPFNNNIARVGLYGKSMKIKNRTMNVYKQPLYTLLIHLNADDILF